MPSRRPDQMPLTGGSWAMKAFQGGLPTPLPRTRPSIRRERYLQHEEHVSQINDHVIAQRIEEVYLN